VIKAYTVEQMEEGHPGIRGKLRGWITKADAGDPTFGWLRMCIIRIGRSVLINDVEFRLHLYAHTGTPPAPARNNKLTA
jgi:hypothetical protein